jgi:predicted nucleotidyltransferase
VVTPTPMSENMRARAVVIAARLKEELGAQRVLLFGSVARGTAGDTSDVQLLVIAPSENPPLRRSVAVRRLVDDLSRQLALSPIVITEAELEKRLALGDRFIEEVLRTGVEL